MGNGHDGLLNEAELAAAAEEKETHAFEIDPSQVLWVYFSRLDAMKPTFVMPPVTSANFFACVIILNY